MKMIKTVFLVAGLTASAPVFAQSMAPAPSRDPEGTGNFVAGKPEGTGNFVTSRAKRDGKPVVGKPQGGPNHTGGKPGATEEPAK
ncbi:MAG: hypothetical protein NVSMB26_06560 [Beijerinckiaceae bacterium]